MLRFLAGQYAQLLFQQAAASVILNKGCAVLALQSVKAHYPALSALIPRLELGMAQSELQSLAVAAGRLVAIR